MIRNLALLCPALWINPAHAIGLGELQLQSSLGQALKANVMLLRNDQDDIIASCLKARLELPDGGSIMPLTVTLGQSGNFLQLRSSLAVQEPAIKVVLENSCGSRLRKEYLQLLDPPFGGVQNKDAELATAQIVASSPAPSLISQAAVPSTSTRNVVKAHVNAESKRAEPKAILVPTAHKAKKIADVLKLSDETVVVDQGLKLSHEMAQTQTSGTDKELRSAQQRLMTFLRGEDPDLAARTQAKVDETKIQTLQAESAQLKRQSQADKAALDDIRDSSYSRNWIIALVLLMLLGFAALSYLFFRIYKVSQNKDFSWWEQKTEKSEPERKRNIEEIVNSVQASYGPTTGQQYFNIDEESTKPGLVDSGNSLDFEPAHPSTAVPVHQGASEAPITTAKVELPSLEDTNSSTFNFFPNRGNSLKVDEISDVTQEAEFWMSVNDPHRAIAILEPQSADEHPESPVPWLYLLDLYRVTGLKDKYEILRDRFIVFFNANIPEFDTDLAAESPRHLETFTHLMEKICSLWNTNEILPFLESLLVDDRGGKRLGFDLPVYRDILLLIAIANELERAKAFGLVPDSGWTTV